MKASTKVLSTLLDTLDKREKGVLKGRFGIGGEKKKTLEELGRIYKVTGTTIRQIEIKALTKLKRHNGKLLTKFQNVLDAEIGEETKLCISVSEAIEHTHEVNKCLHINNEEIKDVIKENRGLEKKNIDSD